MNTFSLGYSRLDQHKWRQASLEYSYTAPSQRDTFSIFVLFIVFNLMKLCSVVLFFNFIFTIVPHTNSCDSNAVMLTLIVFNAIISGCSDPGPDPDPELMEPIQPSVSVSPHGRFERLQEDPNYISHFTRAPGHKGQRRLHCFLVK